jgi:acetyltransferase-like isoleucine patch superfamily enzyme
MDKDLSRQAIYKSSLVKKVFNRIETLCAKRRVNWFATLYLNFRTLPPRIAYKLPIYVYGSVTFVRLAGSIRFEECDVRRGMVKLGRHRDDYSNSMKAKIRIDKKSVIVFKGLCSIARGYVFRVTDGGTLEFGHKVWLGESIAIDCANSIVLEEGASVTHDCFLSDSNHHYIIDADNNIRRSEGKIHIGRYNWIGNNTTIIKGTVTSDYTIVSQRSLLLKDYVALSGTIEPLTLAGSPARVITKGARRVFRGDYEQEIISYFLSNPQSLTLKWDKEFDDFMPDRYFK